MFQAAFSLGNFSGQTTEVAGELTADPADLRLPVTGVVRVNPGSLRTGIDGRDRDMRQALGVTRHPEIRFVVQGVEASFPTMTDRSDVLLLVTGRMVINGVERSIAVPGRARLRDDRIWARGETRLNMSDYGIAPPRRLFVFRVADDITVSFDLDLVKAD